MRRSAVLAAAFLACSLLAPPSARADEEARWIRYASVSPDGSRIAFSYQGDLWVVGAEGGTAQRVTSHVDHERSPVWSPDGETLAFASDRHGNFDVFLVAAGGGPETRLTFHSSHDVPTSFTNDGSSVHFVSARQDAPGALVGTPFLSELYAVPVQGGRPRQVLTTPAEAARPDAEGARLVYQDRKGYEDPWRKHHTSSVTRDIWIADLPTGAHRKISDYVGEDRDPVWLPGGGVAYLTEAWGSFNVGLWSPDGTLTQLTKHATHPVRFLSASKDGKLAYVYDGSIWTVDGKAGAEPARLSVRVANGPRKNQIAHVVETDGATEMAVGPEGEQVAFVLRGEVFVASVEHGTTRRVTATPEQERSVTWGKDGRSIYYAAERDGSWNVFRSVIARDEETHFFDATTLREEPVLMTDDEEFQPLVSPDGKHLAFLRNRDEICVLDLESKAVKTAVPARLNYSYADGDIHYAWSADSRFLTFGYLPRKRWLDDVGAVELATGAITNISNSGYHQGRAQFSADGHAIFFTTDRFGRRNHGSWGSDGDVQAVYLSRAAHDRARLSPEEFARLREAEEEQAKKKKRRGKKRGDDGDGTEDGEDGEDKDGKGEDAEDEEPPEPVVLETEGLDRRTIRWTPYSTGIGSFAVSPNGEGLVYFAQVEGQWHLYYAKRRDGDSGRLVRLGDGGGGDLAFSKDGKTLFVRRSNGKIGKVGIGGRFESGGGGGRRRGNGEGGGGGGGGEARFEGIGYRAEMTIDTPRERAYIFHHAVSQVADKFYVEQLHGVDWPMLESYYGDLLPHVNNHHDFVELLSELLGELNASHTGGRYRPRNRDGDQTAAFGLLYDTADQGDGLLVSEVLVGGPLDRADSKVAPGVRITHIDGVPLGKSNPFPLLNRKAGKPTLLGIVGSDGEAFEERVKPIAVGAESQLLYRRMVERRRKIVHEASNGRVGYVHVRGMNDGSFRTVFDHALGREGDRDALVVDTRFNGGGWLHDDLVKFLEGRVYAEFVPRGKQRGDLGTEPFQRWSRPSAVVQSEGNYSDAHIFPYAYQRLGLGKLVGTPVAGTGTAVWWERQIDPEIIFGIPQVGMMTPDGAYLENLELQPDVLVYNKPEEVAQGTDRQLLEAVKVLLEELK